MSDWYWTARQRWRRTYGRLREAREDWPPLTGLVVALTLGLVLGLSIGRWWVPDESEAASERDQARQSEGMGNETAALSARTTEKAPAKNRLDSCAEVFAAQARPLKAVGPAMAQWEVHIGAMNKLVVGAITLAQAHDFWNETREGAARNLAEFGDAKREFAQRTARCPAPAGRASAELRGCAAEVTARHRELRRASVALDTWRTHVRHMEMLRRGTMSPEDATRMWLDSWRKGDRQVDAYRSAARGAQGDADHHRHHEGRTDRPCAG